MEAGEPMSSTFVNETKKKKLTEIGILLCPASHKQNSNKLGTKRNGIKKPTTVAHAREFKTIATNDDVVTVGSVQKGRRPLCIDFQSVAYRDWVLKPQLALPKLFVTGSAERDTEQSRLPV
ncbi:hypothetical protein CBL_10579 [Carabus blaptoides fortunei]